MAVRETKRQCRILRISAEHFTSVSTTDDISSLTWIGHFEMQFLNKVRTGRRWRKPMAQFGENIWFHEGIFFSLFFLSFFLFVFFFFLFPRFRFVSLPFSFSMFSTPFPLFPFFPFERCLSFLSPFLPFFSTFSYLLFPSSSFLSHFHPRCCDFVGGGRPT